MSAQGRNRVKEGGREMLTAKEIGQFHRDGVLALRGVFDREEVRALQRAADEVTAEAIAGRGHGQRLSGGRRPPAVLPHRRGALGPRRRVPDGRGEPHPALGGGAMPRSPVRADQRLARREASPFRRGDPVAPGSALRGTGRPAGHVRHPQLRLRHLLGRGDDRERLSVRARRLSPGRSRRGGALREGGAVQSAGRRRASDAAR